MAKGGCFMLRIEEVTRKEALDKLEHNKKMYHTCNTCTMGGDKQGVKKIGGKYVIDIYGHQLGY